MPLGTEAGLGPGHTVLDGDPAPRTPPKAAQQPLTFRPMSVVVKRSPISATAELLFYRPDALPDAQPTVSKHWRPDPLMSGNVSEMSTRQKHSTVEI